VVPSQRAVHITPADTRLRQSLFEGVGRLTLDPRGERFDAAVVFGSSRALRQRRCDVCLTVQGGQVILGFKGSAGLLQLVKIAVGRDDLKRLGMYLVNRNVQVQVRRIGMKGRETLVFAQANGVTEACFDVSQLIG
jgi:hypothetical protein